MIGTDYRWYALYVTRHHEKKAYSKAKELGIEALLPMRSITRKWSDRVRQIEEPLFPSYLLVKASCREYFEILNHHSVVRYISFGGKPAIIPDKQIESLRKVMESRVDAESVLSGFTTGEKVMISEGPLSGTVGEIFHQGGSRRFRIIIDVIGYSLLMSVPDSILMRITRPAI